MKVSLTNQDFLIGVTLTALLWGGTNPLIKIASKDISTAKPCTNFKLIDEFINLATNWKYIIPFVLNQSGSVVYVIMLQKSDLSFVVPITNSLTFVFTALVGWMLGEARPNTNTIVGMILVMTGTTMCWIDKSFDYE